MQTAPEKPLKNLGMTRALHLYDKLFLEIERFEVAREERAQRLELSYHAFNAAVTAWHISDWIWDEARAHAQEAGAPFEQGELRGFQDGLRSESRALHICYCIANGSKHGRLGDGDRSSDVVVDEVFGIFPRLAADDRTTDAAARLFVVDRGERSEVIDVLTQAGRFWTDYFRERGWIEKVRFARGMLESEFSALPIEERQRISLMLYNESDS